MRVSVLADLIQSEQGTERSRLMAVAYSLVGAPLVILLLVLGGSRAETALLSSVIVLAVLCLTVPALRNRFTIVYACSVTPALVCGLSGDIAANTTSFSTMMMCTAGLSSLHEKVSTVIWAWLSCTAAWVVMLTVEGHTDVLTVVLLSWTYAVAAAILFAKATHMRQVQLQLKTQIAAAQVATRARSQFLSAMSHELRTPLNGVIGTTELLLSGPLSLEQREAVQTIRSSSDWLLSTVTGVLDYARAESGRLTISEAPFEPAALVDAVARLLGPAAHQKGLELIVEVDPAVPAQVLSDGFRVRQALTLLVSNAIKFTPRGHVRVGVRFADGRLCLEVDDTGIGIALKDQARIFEPFTQLDDGVRRQYDGAGLGLALAKEIATRLAGTLEVRSRPNEGSRFTLAVPAPQAGPRAVLPAPLAAHVCHVSSSLDVARAALEHQLLTLGARLGAVDEATIHVLDVPARDGLAWLERQDPSGRRTVALVPQGFVSVREYERLGVVECVPKPQLRLLGEAIVRASSVSTPKPVASSPSRVLELHPHEAPAAAVRALIAEDNPVNAKVLVRLLERLGLSAEVVINGAEALERVSQAPFDLIFMDINMPVMDGLEATRVLRSRGFARPIIAVTARSSADDEGECRRAGMTSFLAKPVNPELLRKAIEQALHESAVARA